MDLVASGAAAPTWLGYLIAAIELFGGLAILFGIKTRWVACALVAWVVIATALGHPFWTMEGAARAANQANFYKNLAIMAAYLLLAITGAGRYSLDHRAVSAPSKAAAASAYARLPAARVTAAQSKTERRVCLLRYTSRQLTKRTHPDVCPLVCFRGEADNAFRPGRVPGERAQGRATKMKIRIPSALHSADR